MPRFALVPGKRKSVDLPGGVTLLDRAGKREGVAPETTYTTGLVSAGVLTVVDAAAQPAQGALPDTVVLWDSNLNRLELPDGTPVPVGRPVAARTVGGGPAPLNSGTVSNGTSTGCNSRHPISSKSGLGTIRLAFAGWYRTGSPSAEVLNPNVLTVQACVVEYPSGTFVPVTFNGGQKSAIVNPGALVLTDPVTIDAPPNAVAYARAFTEARDAAGQLIASGKWPVFNHNYLNHAPYNAAGQGVHSASETDKTTQVAALGTNQVYGPIAVLLENSVEKLSILGVGDSILSGTGDQDGRGWFGYLFDGKAQYLRISQGGESASTFSQVANSRRRLALASRVRPNALIVGHGTNDFGAGARTYAQWKADVEAEIAMLKRLFPEIKRTLICTIPAATQSTDSWATTANQTPFAWVSTHRIAANDAIRAGQIAGVDGYIEIADAWETAHNSGILPAGSTTDGLHPNPAQHQAIAAALNATTILTALGG